MGADGSNRGPTRAMPMRAIVAWPAGAGLIGVFEVLTQAGRIGGSWFATILAIVTVASTGVWPAALSGLVASLWFRRRPASESRPSPTWTVAGVASAAAVLISLIAVPLVVETATAHPIDYPQTATRLWQSGLLLAAPMGLVVMVLALRWFERRWGARGPLIGRVGWSLAVALAAWHLTRGPFFVYFGAPAALSLLVVAAIVAGAWSPRVIPATRGNALTVAGGLVVLAVLGVLGLRHPGARALVLHDARVAPHLIGFGYGWLDRDGDRDHPPWLGGGDCDDDDPAVASWRVEIAANGIDDNCRGGDAPQMAEPDGAPPPDPEQQRPSIVLVTIDTVRADHLAMHGYDRDTMPALGKLGSMGMVFERAYAPANHTFFSVTAILAGQSPERMLVPSDEALPQVRYTAWLPELLRHGGYTTVAVNPPLLFDGKMTAQDLRFDTVLGGTFDYVGKNRGTTAKQVADLAIDVLGAAGDDPLLLWVHFMDPHAVHESPIRFEIRPGELGLLDAYDNELSWVDLHLSRILAAAHTALGKDVVLAVTSDHGEAFGEVGAYGHGFTLREPEIRVPMVIVGPEIPPGRIDAPVSVLGLAPTLAAAAGIIPDPKFSWPPLTSAPLPPVVAENPAFLWNDRRMEVALVEDRYKLVVSRTTNTVLLYDLAEDPGETSNVVGSLPDEVARMQAILDAVLDGR